MHSDLGSIPAPFSGEDLILKSRNGSFPPGYMDAYLAHMRRSHAAARAVIDGIFDEAANDPAELARLHNLRF
jgi:hypothetical protein